MVRFVAAIATWHPVYVGTEFLFLSYKWIVFLVQVYLFFALGPHAFRFLCPRARGFAGPGAGQWWGWRGVVEQALTAQGPQG